MEEKEEIQVEKSGFKVFIKWFLIIGIIAGGLSIILLLLSQKIGFFNWVYSIFYFWPNIILFILYLGSVSLSNWLVILTSIFNAFIFYGFVGGILAVIRTKLKRKWVFWIWIALIVLFFVWWGYGIFTKGIEGF